MRPIFKKARETEALVQLFTKMPIDAPMSFDHASKAMGFTVKSNLAAYQTAKRIAERDYDVVIAAVKGYGFTRINGSAMVDRGAQFFKKVRKGARREAHIQEIAIAQNLPRDEMLRATEQFSRLRIIETTAIGAKGATSNRRVTETPPT